MSDATQMLPARSSFDRHLLAERMRIRRHDQTLLSAAHVRTDVKPHQWAAVQEALQGVPPRVLFADDGDLGRRTQAMALLKELALRGQADRVLVITALNEDTKWVGTMHHDFGLDLERADQSWMNARRREQGPDASLWTRARQRVVMHEGVLTYGDEGRDLVGQPWDVVIVEDALELLRGRKRGDVIAAHAAEAVQNATARIFCCEQPHGKGREAFAELIEVLDPLSVSAEGKPGPHSLQHRMVRRSPATVVGLASEQPTLSYDPVEVELSEAEQAFHAAATTYVCDVYPVLEKNFNYKAQRFTEGMTGALMEHPMAFADALQERVEVIKVSADVAISDDADALLAGDGLSKDFSDEKRTQVQDELRTVADAHADVMFDDELNRIVALVEQAQALNPHAKTRAARAVIDEIFSETPEAPIVVVARHPHTMHAVQAAFAEASWHERVVVHDTFHDEEARAEARSALDAREAPVLITWFGAMTLGHMQVEAKHFINFNLSWDPTSTQSQMGKIQKSTGTEEITWHDLHVPGTREGQFVATLYKQVHPLYAKSTASSTVDGVFDGLDAKRMIMQTVRNNIPADETLQALQADLDGRIEELHAWQEADFFACSSFDADDRHRVEAMGAAAQQVYGTPGERTALVAALIGCEGGTWRPHDNDTYTVALSAEAEATRYAFDPAIARTEDVSYLGPGHPLMETVVERVLESEVLSAPTGQKQVPFLTTPGITFVYRLVFEDGDGQIVHETLYPLYVPADGRAIRPTQGERVLQAHAEAPADHPDVRALRAQRTGLQARAEAALREQVPMIEEGLALTRWMRTHGEEQRLLHRTEPNGRLITEAEAVQTGQRHAAVEDQRALNARPPVLVGWCHVVPE